jgi:hypothetical protein
MTSTKVAATLALAAGAVAAVTLGVPALASGPATGPKMAPDATPEYAAFRSGGSVTRDARLAGIGEGIAHVDRPDLGRARTLLNDVGKYASDVVAFPSAGGGNLCYALLAKQLGDPGMAYCYQPKGENVPGPLAGQHFHAAALEVNDDGVLTQLFGLAFDDVKSIRVSVAGEWRHVPVTTNGFYLELPGVPHRDVGVVEATLANGERQIHDIQQGG